MKLELLLKREPFVSIFTDTLADFLKNEYGWSGKIVWFWKKTLNQKKGFKVNSKLNVIYPDSLPRYLLRELTAEYSYHPNPVKHVLQSLYVRWATISLFEKFTNNATVLLDPWPEQFERICILPGNHTMRIVRFEQNDCIVILKNGANEIYFQQQIDVRKRFSFLPAPRMYEYDEKAGMYREERIKALPWNRVSDPAIKKNAFIDISSSLAKLYQQTIDVRKTKQWTEGLIQTINTAFSQVSGHNKGIIQINLNKLIARLKSIIGTSAPENIETVLTHGDFQSANIQISSSGQSRFWLIDWEYASRRFNLYDALVFSTQCRSPEGLSIRIQALLDQNSINEISWALIGQNKPKPIQPWAVALFLFEDILLRLQEITSTHNCKFDNGFLIYLSEIEKIQWPEKTIK